MNHSPMEKKGTWLRKGLLSCVAMTLIGTFIYSYGQVQGLPIVEKRSDQNPLAQENGLIIHQSQDSVPETVEKLIHALAGKGVDLFAHVNHSAAAQNVGMELRDEQLLIFGDPKVGTTLMQENPAIGIELPLKILVWKDKNGLTQVAYKDPKTFAPEYGISHNQEILHNMSRGLPQLIAEAAELRDIKKAQSSSLNGEWKVIGCQLNKVWLPLPIFQNFIYKFPNEEQFTLAWGELSFPKYVGGFPKTDKGKIKINTQTLPNTIDLIPDTGPFAGQAFKGIFDLDHDILKANFAFPGKPRPTSFDADEGQVYEIWQRL